MPQPEVILACRKCRVPKRPGDVPSGCVNLHEQADPCCHEPIEPLVPLAAVSVEEQERWKAENLTLNTVEGTAEPEAPTDPPAPVEAPAPQPVQADASADALPPEVAADLGEGW